MPHEERRRRMRALDRRVASRDLRWWTTAFLDLLAGAGASAASAA
jgi:trehalose-6-phosphate synthase